MDIGEKIFGRLSGWRRTRNLADYAPARLDDELPAVYLLSQASERGALVLAGDVFGSVSSEVIRLPSSVRLYKEGDLNRFVLLHKALAAGAILRAGLAYPERARAPWSRALAVEHAIPGIRNELRKAFPGYDTWSEPYFRRLAAAGADLLLDADDRAWVALRRAAGDLSWESADRLPLRTKRLVERIPAGVLGPWIGLLKEPPGESGRTAKGKMRSSKAPSTESQSPGGGEAESVDLNSQIEQDNPVSHSFEKLETAEEYKGGFRAADGSDQLQDHQQALEELRLDKVTRDGEGASSQYSADLTGVFDHGESAPESARSNAHVFLPEWDYKLRRLKPEFCRLYTEKVNDAESGEAWLGVLKEKYSDQINRWEPRLWGLMNQRRWKDRELDGPDFSIDAAIRYFADSRHGGQADPRLFTRMQLQRRDYAVLLLLDQSLSTDSWVANRRILDVELDSIGLVGALTQVMREPVAVAGTWSETRNHCHFRTYKGFDEDWRQFYGAASKIEPMGYTRLGPALRHASSLLRATGAKRKLLIVLTDGKPTDYDRYEGRYGIEDIHHAFLEARQGGVTVKALAIEDQARHYFPFLFGAGGYCILNDPAELPAQLFKIYMEARSVA